MATYQDIKGLRVKYLSADPSNIADGEVWYNTTSGTLKAQVLKESTSSANNMNTGRYAIGSAGTLTAGLAAAGDLFPSPSRGSNATEEYDGTSWASANNVGTGRSFFASCGTQTAAIGSTGYPFSGPTTTATEEYNGASWSSGTAVPTACEGGNQFGIQTASIFIEGGLSGPSYPSSAYTQTGGAWTSIPSLNNDKNYGAMTNGTTAAGISVGGGNPQQDHVEEWDGTSWAASTAFPTANYNAAGNSCGTQTAMSVAGGTPGTQITIWDGSAWSISPASLATSRSGRPASAGTSTAFYVSGGSPQVVATEEFSTDPAVETITVS